MSHGRHAVGRMRGVAAALIWAIAASAHAQTPAPRILLDQPIRAVEYQLNRLSNDDLARVDRRADDPRYRPVYVALLTRRGLAPAIREEAVTALAALDRSPRADVIVQSLTRVPDSDAQTTAALLALLFAEPSAALAAARPVFATSADDLSSSAAVLAAAYGGMLLADASADAAWSAATRKGHLAALAAALAHMPWRTSQLTMASQVFARTADLVEDSDDPAVRRAAMAALPAIQPDAAAFGILAGELVATAADDERGAAVRALQSIPRANWPADGIEPVARRLVAIIRGVPENRRTEPGVLDALELGGRLAAALPADAGRDIRRELRSLGVQVVRIAAVREEIRFDVKWFAVEAGRPVEIVLVNPDAMPHNLIVGRPGSLEEIGVGGSAMPMPVDPATKPFVPDTPLVLYATGLVGFGEEARLRFTAPREPGDYPFVCTFPGHWLRMYGTMLVVANLEEWEGKPTPPTDPMTKQPYASER